MRKGLCSSCSGAAFFWDKEFWFHYTHFPGEQMGRYWSISVSRRLTLSLVISSHLGFKTERAEKKIGLILSAATAFISYGKRFRYLCWLHFSVFFFFPFVFPFWFLMSLLGIFRGNHLFCGRHEARQLLLTLGKGEDVTLSGVSLRCWWMGWQIHTGRLVSLTRLMMWKAN